MDKLNKFLNSQLFRILFVIIIVLFTLSISVFATLPFSLIQIIKISSDKNIYEPYEAIKVNIKISCHCKDLIDKDRIDGVGIYASFDTDFLKHTDFYKAKPVKTISLSEGDRNQAEIILPPQVIGKHELLVSVIKLSGDSGYRGDTNAFYFDVVEKRELLDIFNNFINFLSRLFKFQ